MPRDPPGGRLSEVPRRPLQVGRSPQGSDISRRQTQVRHVLDPVRHARVRDRPRREGRRRCGDPTIRESQVRIDNERDTETCNVIVGWVG